MAERPTGTVTFLFTDIVGSTRLWQAHAEAMADALAIHDDIVRSAIETHDGYVFATGGDGFAAAFATASNAIAAAIDAQHALGSQEWGEASIAIRMGLHSGEAVERAGDYFGPTLNRAARLMAVASGGQVAVTEATVQLLAGSLPTDAEFVDIGEYQLRDIALPEHVYQLRHPRLADRRLVLPSTPRTAAKLPRRSTSFVGRTADLERAKSLLRDGRLLTITGFGGVGKTSLAVQLARDALDAHDDGACFVDLTATSGDDLVTKQVATALGVQEQADRSIEETLFEWLATRDLLIVIDNAEHVIDAVASLAQGIIDASENVRLVVTSREALGAGAETQLPLQPLALPDDVDDARSSEAVLLFAERARKVDPGFRLDDSNIADVLEVCRRLDGVPLAIELAAARISLLSPSDMASRLDDRLGLVSQGQRTAAPRQQTLRATIDWSYDLLDETERRMLQTLSVFVGGFTLDAVEAVAHEDTGDALGVLGQLLAKSLVADAGRFPTRRFTLLDTVRQYAYELLGDTEAATLHRHRTYFAAWAAEQGRLITTADQLRALDALEADHANLRAVLERTIDSGDIEVALEVAAEIAHFWWLHSHFAESARWFERLLDLGQDAPPRVRAKLLMGSGELAMSLSDHDLAEERFIEARDLARLADARRTEAWCEASLLTNDVYRLQFAEAREHGEAAMAIFNEIGDIGGIGYSMMLLTGVDFGELVEHGPAEPDRLRELSARLEPVLAGAEAFGERNLLGHVHDLIAPMAIMAGDNEVARSHLTQAIAALDEVGNQICLAHVIDHVAQLANAEGEHTEAAMLLGGSHRLRDHLGVAGRTVEQLVYDTAVEEAGAELGEARFSDAWNSGEELDRRQLVSRANAYLDTSSPG